MVSAIKKFVRRKVKEIKERRRFSRKISIAAEAAARGERAKQEVRLAIASERIRADRRLAAFKAKTKKKAGPTGFQNFAANFVDQVSARPPKKKGGGLF